MNDNQQNWQFLDDGAPSLTSILADAHVLQQLVQDGLGLTHLAALDRLASNPPANDPLNGPYRRALSK